MFPKAKTVADGSSVLPVYDVILHIGKLNDLLKDGWKFTIPNNLRQQPPESKTPIAEYRNSLLVGMLGSYNRGKSFLLNRLCKTQFPSGRLVSTEGISIAGPREACKNVTFIDTAGTDTPITRNDLEDKRAVEALLREIVLHLCSYIIIVTNRLHLTDQIYMQEVLDYCSKISTSSRPEIIFVHNLLDLESEEDVENVIRKEIQGILGAEAVTIQQRVERLNKDLRMFRSSFKDIILSHFILAKDGSRAGNKWNEQTLDSLMSILQADIAKRKDVCIMDEILCYINNKLPLLFSSKSGSDIVSSQLSVVKHDTEPYIVLSELKCMPLEKRKDISSSLAVSPRVMYDQRGYLIGIVSAGTEKWEPRYRQFKTKDAVKIYVELCGFNRNNVRIRVNRNIINVTGERNGFEGSENKSISELLRFPIGPFELRIIINEDIDSKRVTVQWDEGLLTITCPIVVQEELEIQ